MKMKKHAAGVLIGAALSTLSYQSYADVILHAFNWTYDDVAAKAQEIADLGYTNSGGRDINHRTIELLITHLVTLLTFKRWLMH